MIPIDFLFMIFVIDWHSNLLSVYKNLNSTQTNSNRCEHKNRKSKIKRSANNFLLKIRWISNAELLKNFSVSPLKNRTEFFSPKDFRTISPFFLSIFLCLFLFALLNCFSFPVWRNSISCTFSQYRTRVSCHTHTYLQTLYTREILILSIVCQCFMLSTH